MTRPDPGGWSKSAGISHPGKADEYMPGSQVGSQAGKTMAFPAVAALPRNSHSQAPK